MKIKKILILLFLLLFIFIKPSDNKCSSNENHQINSGFSFASGSNQINIAVKKTGWNEKLIYLYSHFILNYNYDFESEKGKITELPGTFEKDFLSSLIFKRELKFKKMFELLLKSLKNLPEYYPFYNELVFSAAASNNINRLTNELKNHTKLPEKYFSYSTGLINSSEGNYGNSFNFLNSVFQEDSLNKNVAYHYSYSLRYMGEYEKAHSVLSSAKSYHSNDTLFLIEADIAEGSLYFILGDYASAEKSYKKGYNFTKLKNDKINQAKALVNLGILESIDNNFDGAKNSFNEAVNIAEEINDLEGKAFALSESGVLSTYTNNLIEAKSNYLKSYELYKKLGSKLRLSYLSENIGKIYFTIFDFKSALKFYNEGLSFAGDNKRATVMNLMGIADVYSNLSNYTKALEYYKKAKEISSHLNEISLNAEISSGLGTLNYNLERYSSAIKYFDDAIELSKKAADPFIEGDVSYRHGLTYLKADSLDKAKECFQISLKIAQDCDDFITEAFSTRDIAKIYFKNGDINKAIQFLNEAEKIAEETGWNYLSARNKLLKGEINLNINNFDEAKQNLQASIEIAKEINDFNIQIEAYYFLAQLFDKNNLNEAAESYYSTAINLIEDVSSPLFTERDIHISYNTLMLNIYNSFADYYLKNNKYKEAFEIIDKSRSKNLMQNLNNLKLHVLLDDEEILEKVYEYEWMIHTGIYSPEEINSIKSDYHILKMRLVKNNPNLNEYLNLKKSVTIDEIQNELSDNENIISIYSSNIDSYLFLIGKNNFKTFKLGLNNSKIDEFKNAITPYYNGKEINNSTLFNQDLFSFNTKAAFEFYKKILEPAVKNIPLNNNLIISPSTELILFPFEFLVTDFSENQSSYNYADKDYLINKYNISYTPSAAIYIEQKQNSLENDNKILLVGNPSINKKTETFAERRNLLEEAGGSLRNISLLPLKYSGEEIAQIGNIINANKILLENDATETNFKLNAEYSKIIHLSTHSFLYNKQPLIFFSNFADKDNDGFLEAGEIVQLKLNSDLVVLSSCNSGLGRIDESEGIVGMTKAFYEAGAKSIVVSLWEVNDKYTSKLMTFFYEKLSEGYDKAEALRKAKLDFIKNVSPNPYYWGAFVLSGNTSEITLQSRKNLQPYFVGIFLIIAFSFLIIYMKRENFKIL